MTDITDAQKKALLKLEGFKEIRDQYAKEQKMAGGAMRKMKGKGFWSDVGDWFKRAGTTVNDFLKRTKLLSNVAGAVLPLLAPIGTALLTANPIASAASVGVAKGITEGIKSLGYGKMRGGDARLSIVPPGMRLQAKSMMRDQRLVGMGVTRQYNGLITQVGKGRRMMRGRGAGTEYGTVSSAFGEIKA